MAKYLVACPYKCVQTYLVDAKTPAEAKRKANAVHKGIDDEVEGEVEHLDWHVQQHYAPISAKEITHD